MAIDTTSPRTRRTLLSAAAGAVGAPVAQVVLPRSAVEAANGDPLVLGSASNVSTASTTLSSVTSLIVLHVDTNDSQGVHGPAILGTATSGSGVVGSATTGSGVVGDAGASSGIGVFGHAPVGIGVYAKSENAVALKVDGKVQFNRSGKAWIRAGQASLTLSIPGTAPTSRIFAVLASNRPSRYVRAAVPGTGSFTVYLNASALSDSVVSWFILD